ncbi:MAG TPA: carboxypeptidase-like regulatory domain-containing protein [Puia sp.]|nr:carboxypeptidase-like regulatory domain-containing protein [Puia sp.]
MSFFTRRLPLLIVLSLSIAAGGRAWGQVTIHGTVFNMYRTRPLDRVTVMSSSGRGTVTDSTGSYEITVPSDDSIYFSYLGRATAKYPVKDINTLNSFDIALHVDPTTLKEVNVMPRSYHMDSLQNRKDYEKYFDFKKPNPFTLSDGSGGLGMGAGFDLDQIIRYFQFDRTKRLLAFQRRLVEDEQDKFIDHRFNPSMVLKVTHLQGDALDSFMVKYRPSYSFCKRATDYDLLEYTKLAFTEYQNDRKENP